jgi:hypothetical protein
VTNIRYSQRKPMQSPYMVKNPEQRAEDSAVAMDLVPQLWIEAGVGFLLNPVCLHVGLPLPTSLEILGECSKVCIVEVKESARDEDLTVQEINRCGYVGLEDVVSYPI